MEKYTYVFVTNQGFIEFTIGKPLGFPKINSETVNVLLYGI